jgi:hypothetical protein
MFDKVKNSVDVSFYSGDGYSGIDIGWSLQGVGFGHLYFGHRGGKWIADTECMSKESIAKIIEMAAPVIAEKLLKIEAGEDVSNLRETDKYSIVIGGPDNE